MFNRKVILALAVVLTVTLLVGTALVQAGAGGARGNRGGQGNRGGGQGAVQVQPGDRGGAQGGGRTGPRFDPEQMRQMMQRRLQQQLGATDEAWKTLGPRVTKVYELNQQLSGSGRGMMFGGGRRGGQSGRTPAGPDAPVRELSAVEKASEQLTATLESDSAKAEDITKQLAELRKVRAKTKEQLATAQQELRKDLPVSTEARLVLMGLLD
ncbi:MAG: hypothetical protein JW720_07085 [Sedimentisphaerales bacterium]|nr:hypothetical protein [Sedimentisphaerales bacterium]